MHQVLRPPTELNAIILSSQSSHSLLPGAGIISMPFNSIIITRYTGHVVHFPPGNIIGLRIFSKIILWRQNYHLIILQDIAHARLDCYPPRYQRWQDYPTCVYSKHCTFFWQCPHSLNHKKAFDTCFIRREDRFISHPCRISAYSKWLPSNIAIQASSKITSKSHRVIILPSPASITIHFSQEMFSLLLNPLSCQQSKEIPIWNKCWLDWQQKLHIWKFTLD